MSNAVTIKKPKNARSMRRLAQILREFNTMDLTIEKLAPKSGDVLFFKVGDTAKLHGPMIEAFLQHLHERGINDCMAMVLAPEDSVEPLSSERLAELATAVGYVKTGVDPDQHQARLQRQKGRIDVFRLLQSIEKEMTGSPLAEKELVLDATANILSRVREAIDKAAGNGKEVKPAEPKEAPVEIPYT